MELAWVGCADGGGALGVRDGTNDGESDGDAFSDWLVETADTLDVALGPSKQGLILLPILSSLLAAHIRTTWA